MMFLILDSGKRVKHLFSSRDSSCTPFSSAMLNLNID